MRNSDICKVNFRGRRHGTSIIDSNVYIGTKVIIVGRLKLGNDVLIAPNSFVNFDVPNHNVVIGNPDVIKHNVNAIIRVDQ